MLRRPLLLAAPALLAAGPAMPVRPWATKPAGHLDIPLWRLFDMPVGAGRFLAVGTMDPRTQLVRLDPARCAGLDPGLLARWAVPAPSEGTFPHA